MKSRFPQPCPAGEEAVPGQEGGIPHFQKMLVVAFLPGGRQHPWGPGRAEGSAWSQPLQCGSLEGESLSCV